METSIENQAQEISYLNATISEQRSKISEYESNQEKLNFYEKYVVIVPNNGSSIYHKYGCSKLNASRFWAYNTEAAKDKNYVPCNSCCK